MIDDAAEGCSAVSCYGWAFTKVLYQASTLGFASIHDPAKDAYDSGRITGKQYAGATTAALAAPAIIIGTGGTASGLVAATTTTATRIGTTALIGATYGGGLDAYAQGTLIATDVQESYNVEQTLKATAAGAILAPAAVEGTIAAVRTVETVIASRAASSTKATPKISVEKMAGDDVAAFEPLPGDANYQGPIPEGSWRLTQKGQGAHLIEKANIKSRPELAKYDTPETPRFYPEGSPEAAGQAHIRLHRATRAEGIKLKNGNPQMSDVELLKTYEKAYSRPEIQGILGEVRTPKGKPIPGGKKVVPKEAYKVLLENY